MTRLRHGVLLVSAVTAMLAIPNAAYAADGRISVNLGGGWTHDSSTPLLDVSRIAPGWTDSRSFEVRNDSDSAATLALSATDIVEMEDGCNHPEAVVDATCGADQGELGHEMRFTIFTDPDNDGTFEAAARWTGGLYDLQQPAILADALAAHAVTGIRIDAELPFAAGNETQTDQVGFGLRVTLDGAGGSVGTTVEGTKTTRHPPQGLLAGLTGALPFTGSPIGRLVGGAAWLLLAGGLLMMIGLLRRMPTKNSHIGPPNPR